MKTYLKILLIVLPYFTMADEQPGLMWKREISGNERNIIFSGDSRYIAIDEDSFGGRIHIVTVETNEVVHTFTDNVIMVNFSPDNEYFYYVRNSTLIKTRIDEWQEIASIELGMNLPASKYFNLNFTYDGKHAILSKGYNDNTFHRDPLGIDIYNLETMQLERHIETSHPANFASMSYDKRYLAFSWDKDIHSNNPPDQGRRTWGVYSEFYDLLLNQTYMIDDTLEFKNKIDMKTEFSPGNSLFVYRALSANYVLDINNIYDVKKLLWGIYNLKPWTQDGSYISILDHNINIYSTETWEKVIEFPNFYNHNAFAVNNDINRAVLYSPGGGSGRMSMVNLTGTSVELETNYNLSITPNTFYEQAEIRFSLQLPGLVKLSILDTIGNETIIKDELFNQGNHSIIYQRSPLMATGMYILKLEVNGSGGQIAKLLVI